MKEFPGLKLRENSGPHLRAEQQQAICILTSYVEVTFGSFTGILHVPMHQNRLRDMRAADPMQFLPPAVRASMQEAVDDGFYKPEFIRIAASNHQARAIHDYITDLKAMGIEVSDV